MQCILRFSLLLVFLNSAVVYSAGQIQSLETRRGAQQYFYVSASQDAVATVILFVGGKGKLLLRKKGSKKLFNSNNFLARSRQLFKKQKFNLIYVDAPSDHLSPSGMFGFRASPQHAEDIGLVVNYARKFSLPVWLIGTSRGTESVVNAIIRLPKKGIDIDGIVLTASMTEKNKRGVAVSEMNVSQITVPVLIISHKNDACRFTTPLGSKKLSQQLKRSVRVKFKLVSAGDKPVSRPCKARSAHGFWGIESEVVELIGQFIRQ
ncbi:hypothetical protein MNBD_GAMMA12-165 [hydrothermal vent metagenome]|uniref:Alpha/beta hydrolase n=1 Tax=hydrothermal vent metagenome TaxID=652676 RepID=A0A3B0YDW3_9ZZZZ